MSFCKPVFTDEKVTILLNIFLSVAYKKYNLIARHFNYSFMAPYNPPLIKADQLHEGGIGVKEGIRTHM